MPVLISPSDRWTAAWGAAGEPPTAAPTRASLWLAGGLSLLLHGAVLGSLLPAPASTPQPPAPAIIPVTLALLPAATLAATTARPLAATAEDSAAPPAPLLPAAPPPVVTTAETISAASPDDPPATPQAITARPDTVTASAPLTAATAEPPPPAPSPAPETATIAAPPARSAAAMAIVPPAVTAITAPPAHKTPPPKPAPAAQARAAALPPAGTAPASASPMAAAPPSAPATPPPADNRADLVQRYTAAISRRIDQLKHYPDVLRSRRVEGTVAIAFSVTANGTISAPTIAESSGNSILDRSALATVSAASPLPPPPAGLPATLKVSLLFRLE